jgi:hypothetical protein
MISRTSALTLAATVFNAFLGGGGLDRVAIQMPAWRQVGIVPWAEFSRHADLGNGLILYPVAAIGGTLLSIAAVISFHWDREQQNTAKWFLYAGACLTLLGLLWTTQAAPLMLSLRHVGNDPPSLEHAFTGFDWWGRVRAVTQMAAFLANLGSVALLGVRTEKG